jgi:YVTN family beta-propeller protein
MSFLFHSRCVRRRFRSIATLVCLITIGLAALPASVYAAASRSTNIALTEGDQKLVAVNTDSNSVTVFEVKGGGGSLRRLAEISVGREPHCVAVKGNNRAFVTIAQSGSVWVIDLNKLKVTKKIQVGTEPRGCALAPNGRLYVANHTEGTVSVIDTSSERVIDTIGVGGNPFAIAIDNNRVFVTQLYARLIDDGDDKGEGFDDEKEGVVQTFLVNNPGSVTEITLSPMDSSFTANRVQFCKQLTLTAANDTFCPDTTITDPNNPVITQDPQMVFPNQLMSALACSGRLYLPNIGAQPEPPQIFNANIQALVDVVDIATLSEQTDLHVNLNAQIKTEADPGFRAESLARLFGNDLAAIDADQKCENFFIVSRGGNYVLRAKLKGGKLDIGAPDNVVRFQTGNIPSGIVVGGKFAYVNNEVNLSVSILDLQANTVVARDVSSSKPPEPGSFDHTRSMGKLVFHTALGVPDNGLRGMQIRDVIPLKFRGKQSDAAWSTCASCHFEGLTDHVTAFFADGPRNTIPLDGTYSKIDGAHDIRINNWSAARDGVTEFNNNSRNVQCGSGFAGGDAPQAVPGVLDQNGRPAACPGAGPGLPNPAIFDHGIEQGGSDALDVETTWVLTVRPLNQPKPADPTALDAGAQAFNDNCASCHGGAKWTKSQVLYLFNPALDKAFAAGGTPRDPGLTMTANQSVSYQDAKVDTGTLKFLEDIGTFNAANPIEIRGQGALIGQTPLGVLGFNAPSLLSTNYHAPYFHNGAAQTLEEVFAQHLLPGGGKIQDLAGAAALLEFVKAIDGRTATFESQADIFKDPFRGPCC